MSTAYNERAHLALVIQLLQLARYSVSSTDFCVLNLRQTASCSTTLFSRYNHLAHFPRLKGMRESIASMITSFFNTNIKQRLASAFDRCVVDFAVVLGPDGEALSPSTGNVYVLLPRSVSLVVLIPYLCHTLDLSLSLAPFVSFFLFSSTQKMYRLHQRQTLHQNPPTIVKVSATTTHQSFASQSDQWQGQ